MVDSDFANNDACGMLLLIYEGILTPTFFTQPMKSIATVLLGITDAVIFSSCAARALSGACA
jgi:hypothetical protein